MEILTSILTTSTLIVFIVCLIYAFIQLFKAFKNMFSISSEYKPGVKPWSSQTLFNPYNGLIFTHLLTQKGKTHARLFWQSMGKFLLVILLAFTFVFLTELITGVQLVQH